MNSIENMHNLPPLRRASVTLLATVALVLGAAGAANAAMSPEKIGKMVTAEFGVKVLKVKLMTSDDRPAFAVTVLSPGGDRNSAFQVNTFVVDADTGKPVAQYGNAGGRQQWAAPAVSHRTHPLLATDK